MKKTVNVLVFIIIFFFIFSVNSFAEGSIENELIEKSQVERIRDNLDKEAKEFLSDVGADSSDSSLLLNLNYKSFLKAIINSFKENLKDIKLHFLSIITAVLLCSLFDSFSLSFKEKNKGLYNLCTCFFVASVSLIPLINLINSSEGLIIASCELSGAVIPILCTISAAQGKTISAGVFNSAAIVFSQLISEAYVYFFVPGANILLALSISSCTDSKGITKEIVKIIKKYFLILLSVCASLYFTIIGIKGSLSTAADESAIKALKLAAGNFVPVIGGAISDSASALLSSLSITKSAVGVFGILALLSIFVPLLIKILLWILGFDLCSALAGSFSQENINELLKTVSSVLSIFAVMLIFCALMMIVNIGILTSLRG